MVLKWRTCQYCRLIYCWIGKTIDSSSETLLIALRRKQLFVYCIKKCLLAVDFHEKYSQKMKDEKISWSDECRKITTTMFQSCEAYFNNETKEYSTYKESMQRVKNLVDILNYSSEIEQCPICSSPKLVFNPLEPFSSLCSECDMELDRCCFTFQLIGTELQNVHSCPSCKVVGIANSYQYVTKNESILFDEEFELDNSIGIGCSNNILCPFCSVMMLPL